MKILYIHQYFITPNVQGGTRSYEFSKYLSEKSHDVTIITSGILNEEFPVKSGEVYSEFKVNNVRLISISAGYNDARKGTCFSGLQRVIKFLQFSRMAKKVGKMLDKPDVIFATHTPLMVGLSGIALGKHFKVPFVFEVRDLWPDALINIGVLKNPFIIWWMRNMEKKIYNYADHVVALSPGMKEGIIKSNISPEKISVIPNASDINLFKPENDGKLYRSKLGLGDKFVAIYFGAMGKANGLEYVVDAAKILSDRGTENILLVLHGDGGERQRLKELVRQYKLKNIVFSDPLPSKRDLASLVSTCDVCLTIYRAAKEQSWSPNKMFDAFAAGKPVLINVKGWLGDTVEKNNCGYSLDPQEAHELAFALERLADNKNSVREMGENSRKLAENEFSREKLAQKLESILIKAVKK